MQQDPFNYDAAFSRNLGWTTEWEQAALRTKRVAIAGMGGAGGIHLITLARLGVGRFHIADFDRFDIVNMNRQAGATVATIGRPKVTVMSEIVGSINPEAEVVCFPDGATRDNLDAFLNGCDLFVDGLDFFALDIRELVFRRCEELGIPAVTAAPIGMGVGYLAFLPGKMTFERYFRLQGHSEEERSLRFLMGVAPRGLHRTYLADDTRVDLAGKRGPSTAAACALCAGVVSSQAVRLLLGRGVNIHAPVHLHFDAYRGKLARSRLRWGNSGPIQSLKLAVARRIYGAMTRQSRDADAASPEGYPPEASLWLAILDLARWAPSGDNEQPWRFAILDVTAATVRVADLDVANPYEYRGGEPTLLSVGMLLESIRIAASAHRYTIEWMLQPGGPPWRIRIRLIEGDVSPNPLVSALSERSVVRGAMGCRPITDGEKTALARALGDKLRISWHEDIRSRMLFARLGMMATDIRLRSPEAYEVHRRAVDWDRKRSPAGIPAGAIGLNGPTLKIMRWGMNSWSRMDRLNGMFGTGGAGAQLDAWPALNSSAFFVIKDTAPQEPTLDGDACVSRILRIGERLQRFWLTATHLGLAIQPTTATLAFAEYGVREAPFTRDPRLLEKARRLAARAIPVLSPIEQVRFVGRIGVRKQGAPGPRSIRKPLADLVQPYRRMEGGEVR